MLRTLPRRRFPRLERSPRSREDERSGERHGRIALSTGERRRLLAFACYLGLDPVRGRWRRALGDAFIEHHFLQASALLVEGMGLVAVAIVALTSVLAFMSDEMWLFVVDGDFAVRRVVAAFGLPALALLLPLALRLRGALSALRGTWAEVPFSRWLAGTGEIRRLRAAARGAEALLLAGLVGFTLHASMLVRPWTPGSPAACYMLYDDGGRSWPRWFMSLGFYRVARASTARFGPRSVVVEPFSDAALADALRYGKLVFLATHGSGGSITTARGWSSPDDVAALAKGPHLQLVYVCGCGSGYRAQDWKAALSPAEVVTFPRQSLQSEHFYWLFTEGPRRVARLQ